MLGSLPFSEMEQVAGAMCRFPEVKQEIDSLESMLLAAAEKDAVTPPRALEESIWAAIQNALTIQQTNTSEKGSTMAIPLEENFERLAEKDAPKTIALSGKTGIGNWARAAVWVALVGSLVGNYSLWNGRNNDKQEVAVLQQKMQGMSADQTALNDKIARYTKEAEMAAQPGIQPIAMLSTQPGHPMAATFYWNKAKHIAFVSVQKLPPAPEGMQYQLWAIVEGKPVSLGMMDNSVVANGGMQRVPDAVMAGQIFCVSLEKEGGNPSPTADKIYLMGKMPA